jgi:hypothetical protein
MQWYAEQAYKCVGEKQPRKLHIDTNNKTRTGLLFYDIYCITMRTTNHHCFYPGSGLPHMKKGIKPVLNGLSALSKYRFLTLKVIMK